MAPEQDGRLCLLFPGQGAREVHRATQWLRDSPLLQLALTEAGLTAAELDAKAGRALERTEVLQPVLTAVSLAVHAQLPRLQPALLLGHSLGEVAALAAAGVLSPEDAVRLAARRGALMAREASTHPGGLVAFDSEAAAQRALDAIPGLQLAARNAPDEVVLSGTADALAKVRGGRRVPVSGPWHHAAMAGAVEAFRGELSRFAAHPPQPGNSILRNADGEPGLALSALADQLTAPVEFTRCLGMARARGVDTFVTVGPGLVLRGLVRKNLGASMRVLTTEDAADLQRTVVEVAA